MGFFSVYRLFLFCYVLSVAYGQTSESFIKCLSDNSPSATPITNIVYSPNNSSFSSILQFSLQNLLFSSSTTPKPRFIITPLQESHIQAAVICSKRQGFLILVRSGGHDYEGLSYVSTKPFIIIDLVKFNKVNVNVKSRRAWVQAGATIGEVYYRIAEKSRTLAFPAGVCTTMGVGGHIGGGGIGLMKRKHSLAADNIVDATFIDVNGKILDRKSMGEDLFWAIRGAQGSSFGVIVSWKIRLVTVPSVVTVFTVGKTLSQGATNLFYKWQTTAPKFPREIVLRTIAQLATWENPRTIQVVFQALFQGTAKDLLTLMRTNFPELGIEAKDCTEMSWINSTLTINGMSGQPLSVLLNRAQSSRNYFKGRSDFVKKAISVSDLEGIWKTMLSEDRSPMIIAEPMGGVMGEIAESAIAFPHRAGNLYNIQYTLQYNDAGASATSLASSRKLYNYMTPYVSESPRASYINYKDLDLGKNTDVSTSYSQARVWGEKYFKGNFARLACVKSKVDPGNYFWNEQSIPPFCASSAK
ncbi:cinnamyl-alcohol dehydrogenase [Ranunculus cassubicifolius]